MGSILAVLVVAAASLVAHRPAASSHGGGWAAAHGVHLARGQRGGAVQQRISSGRAFHVRRVGGTWRKTEIPVALGAFGRSQIVLDAAGNAYVVPPSAASWRRRASAGTFRLG